MEQGRTYGLSLEEEGERRNTPKSVWRGTTTTKDKHLATVRKKRVSAATHLKMSRRAAILTKDGLFGHDSNKESKRGNVLKDVPAHGHCYQGRALGHGPKEEGERDNVLEDVQARGHLDEGRALCPRSKRRG